MKKVILILGMLIPLNVLVSCSDWLDVEPKAEIELSTMHETEQGIKDALIGCYILMSDEALYGAQMTCTFMEVLGQQFALLGSTASSYYDASRYIYTEEGTENIIDGIWSGLYNVIANVNALIEGMESNEGIMRPTAYALLRAEAYSLRAFCYLDLVRCFTPGNLVNRPEKLDEISIPYVKVYDKEIADREKLRDVLQYIHDDLHIALELFEAYDPLSRSGVRPDDYEDLTEDEDPFYTWAQRCYRMNLKAALATQMRLNMWEGNYAAAKQDAEELIDLGLAWAIRLDDEENERDLTFSAEMVFGVETFERMDNVVTPYFALVEQVGENGSNMNYNALYLPQARADELYEIASNVGTSDWRYLRLWDRSEANFAFLKFWEYEDMVYTNRMPLIKTPEIYYTACECLLREGGDANKNQTIAYLNNVRNNRNIPADINLSYDLTEEEAWDELEKEMRKEYMGEGQMFFYYKRIGATSIPYGPAVTYDDNAYVLPIPQDETDFGFQE